LFSFFPFDTLIISRFDMFVNTKSKLFFQKVKFVLSGGFLFPLLIEKVDFDLRIWFLFSLLGQKVKIEFCLRI